MDYFAVATLGSFPTPTPTDSERAAYFCSWGMLDTAPAASAVTYVFIKTLFKDILSNIFKPIFNEDE